MRYEFLVPYSPGLNPIEEAFSKIKAHLRCHRNLTQVAMAEQDDTDVYVRLHEVVWTVTREDAEGWFRHAGY
ncbi:hypothetical protein K439DRAFT_1369610 [Ramaria rubella]|nr:hypothetical protein K439DRAFT_1369610 [Ramaria rubella]